MSVLVLPVLPGPRAAPEGKGEEAEVEAFGRTVSSSSAVDALAFSANFAFFGS